MKNVFESYNSFFNNGNLKGLSSDLQSAGSEVDSVLCCEPMTQQYIDTINVMAAYMSEYKFSSKFTTSLVKDSDAHEALRQSPPFMRLTFNEKNIMDIVEDLMKPNEFPKINMFEATGEDDVAYFDGEFHVPEFNNDELKNILRDAVCVYMFGMPISNLSILPQLKRLYILSGQVMQAVMYISIGTDICNQLCIDAEKYGITIQEWCSRFDNIWFDVSNQVADGFITVFNPTKLQKLICVSTLYIGKYFITNMSVFQQLYEKDTLHTIRFADKEVPVLSMVNGKPAGTTNRIVNVPVYYDGDEELLVSDLIDANYVYNELFINDIGRV